MKKLDRLMSYPARWRRSRGFGVHSPFAYHFITKVLREKDAEYYAYAEIAVHENSFKIYEKLGKDWNAFVTRNQTVGVVLNILYIAPCLKLGVDNSGVSMARGEYSPFSFSSLHLSITFL